MTAILESVRAIALLLPEAEERDGAFLVAGTPFVEIAGETLRVRGADGWDTLDAAGDADWTLIEDRIARSWELSAPRGLLEAGGR